MLVRPPRGRVGNLKDNFGLFPSALGVVKRHIMSGCGIAWMTFDAVHGDMLCFTSIT